MPFEQTLTHVSCEQVQLWCLHQLVCGERTVQYQLKLRRGTALPCAAQNLFLQTNKAVRVQVAAGRDGAAAVGGGAAAAGDTPPDGVGGRVRQLLARQLVALSGLRRWKQTVTPRARDCAASLPDTTHLCLHGAALRAARAHSRCARALPPTYYVVTA